VAASNASKSLHCTYPLLQTRQVSDRMWYMFAPLTIKFTCDGQDKVTVKARHSCPEAAGDIKEHRNILAGIISTAGCHQRRCSCPTQHGNNFPKVATRS